MGQQIKDSCEVHGVDFEEVYAKINAIANLVKSTPSQTITLSVGEARLLRDCMEVGEGV